MEPARLTAELSELLDLAQGSSARYSVMTPRRYHPAYRMLKRYVARYVREFAAPVTYLSIYHGEGVWNTPPEFSERDDHPYRFGYGKLLHSGYHYVDLLQTLLDLNEPVVPAEDLALDLASHFARPRDQRAQVPDRVSGMLEGAPAIEPVRSHPYGETDVVASFAVRRRATGEVVTLGNLGLIQTSTSLRSWWPLPDDVYNKTGRFGVEDIRVNLGFLASVALRIQKVPVRVEGRHISFREEFELTVSRNANLLGTSALERRSSRLATGDRSENGAGEKYLEDARWRLFTRWLRGEETRSRLDQHLRSVRLLEKILLSAHAPA
jgi:hypothetical protein